MNEFFQNLGKGSKVRTAGVAVYAYIDHISEKGLEGLLIFGKNRRAYRACWDRITGAILPNSWGLYDSLLPELY